MHNKWGRRYKRHRDNHSAYFEALARDVVQRRRVTVDLGVASVEVRLKRRRHWLEFVEPDGSVSMGADVGDRKGEALVSVIADYLMQWSAGFPGVEVPPNR
jgi:hypothetical protein